MKRRLIFLLLTLVVFLNFNCATKKSNSISIGHIISLDSEILKEKREILIHLPDSYDQSGLHYPVLYVLDGERHFSFSAGVEDFLSRVGRAPEMIIVGIPNINRIRDFSVGQEENGRADEFIRFLEFELIPCVDSHYRTHPYRILNGWSLTGAFSVYVYFAKPGLFNGFIAMSPSFLPLYEHMHGYVERILTEKKSFSESLFFTLGDEPRMAEYVKRFVGLLEDRFPDKNLWNFALFETEDHGSVRLKSLYSGLEYLFREWPLTLDIAEKGAEAVRDHYKKLSVHYGYDVEIPETFINQVGYELLLQSQIDKAIEIFRLNVEEHTESANAYDSLGEAYERAGQMDKALENYETACQLAEETGHPNLELFRSNLERLRKSFDE